MPARAEFRDSIMDSHASSDIFLGKGNLLHEKTKIYTYFPLFGNTCHLQAANTIKKQKKNQKPGPQNRN